MNPLLLAGGLNAARRCVREAVHRTMLGVAAYALLCTCGLVATGFLTAAGFLLLAETRSAIQTCIIIAGIYALIGVFGFLVLLLVQSRRRQRAGPPILPTMGGSASDQGGLGGIWSMGLLAAAGYLLARSMTRKT